MGYLLARLRLWAAHHRLAWWLSTAGLAGITVQSVARVEPCSVVAEPVPDTAAGKLRQASGESPSTVAAARVLDLEDDTVTVAVPVELVPDLASARRWGDVGLALVPD